MVNEFDYGDIDYPEYEPEYKYDPSKDSAVDQATKALTNFFNEHKSDIFYLKQIQLKFEKKFFHWITYNALKNLEDTETIKTKMVKTHANETIKFLFHKAVRYIKHEIKSKRKVIEEFSADAVTRACGEQADLLFQIGFAKKGFLLCGEDVSYYKEKKWQKTKHNLDFIIEKDGIAYGCEVKNTFDYIDQEEMLTKIEICKFLGLRPLFIMRYAPKNYIDTIQKAGGFALLFETKIFPLGMEKLVEKIDKEFKMPVIISKSIPEGILDRFVNKGHKRFVNLLKIHTRSITKGHSTAKNLKPL